MKTREKILAASLEQFNQCGAPNISTIEIAAQLEISPGNLYYYFKNKEDIISCHFENFKKQLLPALNHFAMGFVNFKLLLDQFEFILDLSYAYCFLFQDAHALSPSNPPLFQKYRSLFKTTATSLHSLLHSLQQLQILAFNSTQQQDHLLDQIIINLYYRPAYNKLANPKATAEALLLADLESLIALLEAYANKPLAV